MYGSRNLARQSGPELRADSAASRRQAADMLDNPCLRMSLAEQVGVEIGAALFDGKEYPDPAFTIEDLGTEVLTALRDPDPAAREQLCRAVEAVLREELARQVLARK
jgi:hypothetical protein